ncbi:hypothetical protein IKG20_02960 [Candidatus Saccharibacteria bacterium]|nr:hypothetical protein [Candidatus Saccharibacteria bacterium]
MEEKSSNMSQIDTALPSSENKREKQKNPFKIATIICAILALAGIGFGVFELLQKPKSSAQDNNTAELESELSNLKQKYTVLQNYVKDLEASGTEIPEDAKSATDTQSADSGINTNDYLYIGSWGQKIKRPNELIYMEYKLTGYSDMECLYVNAGRAIDKNLSATGGPLSNIDVQSLGYVCRGDSKRTPQSNDDRWIGDPAQATFTIGDYSYWYEGPNGTSSDAEDAVAGLLKQMLSNPANYSPI